MALAIKAEGISKPFDRLVGRKQKLVLKGIDLQIEEGRSLVFWGQWCWQDDLLSILSTLLLPIEGRLEFLAWMVFRRTSDQREGEQLKWKCKFL